MAATARNQNETDIAVLQVQVANLNEKVDDLKVVLTDVKTLVEINSRNNADMIKELRKESTAQHLELSKKVSSIENWRWMIIGGALILVALGYKVATVVLGPLSLG